jgi:prepilin-type processing-associated H-X9-DG protein
MPRLMSMPGTWGAVMREANATVRQRQREQVPMADADKLRLRAERMAHGGQHTPMLMVDGHLSDGTVLPSDSSVAVRRSPVRGGGGLLRGAAGIPTSVAAHHLSSLGTTASPGANHLHHPTHQLPRQGSPAAGSPSRRRGGHAEAAKAAASPRPRYDGGSTSTTELISRHPRDVQFRSPKNALLDGAAIPAARNHVARSAAPRMASTGCRAVRSRRHPRRPSRRSTRASPSGSGPTARSYRAKFPPLATALGARRCAFA